MLCNSTVVTEVIRPQSPKTPIISERKLSSSDVPPASGTYGFDGTPPGAAFNRIPDGVAQVSVAMRKEQGVPLGISLTGGAGTDRGDLAIFIRTVSVLCILFYLRYFNFFLFRFFIYLLFRY